MSVLAIADRLRPEFQEIAEFEEVGAPVSEQTVTTIADLLFHSDVASHLPSARHPEHMMFRNDQKVLVRALAEVKDELGKDNYPLDLVEATARQVLAAWEARYPIFKTDLSDADHLAGVVAAIASSIAWLATRKDGDDPVPPQFHAAARNARELLLSAGHSGSARSRQEGMVSFWETLARKLDYSATSEDA